MAKTPSYVTNPQGGVTTGQAASTAVIGAGIGGTFGYFSGKNLEDTYDIYARIAEINADMIKSDATRDINYFSEKAAIEGYAKMDEKRSILSSQKLAMAASGFVSQSAGDKRLLKDTEAKYAEGERLANRALFLKSFERMRKANLAAEELRSQAAQYRIQGKYATLTSTLSGAAQGLNTGVAVVSAANTFYRNTNNMAPMSEGPSDLTQNALNTSPSLDLNTGINKYSLLQQLSFGF